MPADDNDELKPEFPVSSDDEPSDIESTCKCNNNHTITCDQPSNTILSYAYYVGTCN